METVSTRLLVATLIVATSGAYPSDRLDGNGMQWRLFFSGFWQASSDSSLEELRGAAVLV